MTKQTKKLFTEFELIKTNTEDNTFFDYFIKNEYMASKIKAYVLSTAQLKHNVSEKKKKNISVEITYQGIRKFFNFTYANNDRIVEETSKLRNTTFIKSVDFDKKSFVVVVDYELIERNYKSKLKTGFSNVCITLNDLIKYRTDKELFFNIYISYFKNKKDKFINRNFLFNLFDMKNETKEQRKNSKKTLVTMLKKHDFLIKYEDFCFYLKQPVTAKKEAKAEAQPATKAVENAAEDAESEEIGFNRLDAWQEALKRPEIDFMKESETIFENEKSEEELLNELDF
ncbi:MULTISPECIES: hypothetical protein [Vibrio harveyi group]|uniref:Uncharacterized protein n=2 Tax=Vibrio TaxID=662 RepID=A0A9Q3UAA4_VIBPH|nr:hypothetical protein [Vibrio parahaemolyticus]MCC3805104.1 hypothetical protein [Vibrio parahaemolyticus]CAH1572153.1 conserved hypothetical protein [Vibrio harveyi]